MIFPMSTSFTLFSALSPLTNWIKAILVFNVYKMPGLIGHLNVLFIFSTWIVELYSNIPPLLTCIINTYPQVSLHFLISPPIPPWQPPSPSPLKSFCIFYKKMFSTVKTEKHIVNFSFIEHRNVCNSYIYLGFFLCI